MRVLVTGAAGFIGAALSRRLLERGDEVVGIDDLNPYYDVALKKARLDRLASAEKFKFTLVDVADKERVSQFFQEERFSRVVHLAAQAGVRYSIANPHAYISSNIQGFMNVLEGCRHSQVEHLVYASSSSVYGANKKMPFSVHDNVDHPVSLYAATKKANELMAHSYSHLYQLPTTGLRFFTVYGPWGRPDMALFLFTKNILEGKPIHVYNFGQHRRDFTYIDDIVTGIVHILDKIPEKNLAWDGSSPDPGTSYSPYRIYNIGNSSPVWLNTVIETLENAIGKKAEKVLLPLQNGDVAETFADVSGLINDFDFKPKTSIQEGIGFFVKWYMEYYQR